MRILLTGGGTLGSVTPLLALAPELQQRGHEVRFLGTYKGPEKALVQEANIPFHAIVAPKFRRYISAYHLLLPFQFIVAKVQAMWLLLHWRPDAVISAGAFVSVVPVWVGWFLRIPSIIHQQDLQPGLANKLMAPFAKRITVSFEDSLQYYPKQKTEWVGNPVRDLTPTTHSIAIDSAYPTVLIMGGGTGAQGINELVDAELCKEANIIHITGTGRGGNTFTHKRYFPFPFLHEEMKEALTKADVVVSRAGLGSITELAALCKPTLLIPMPNSHQEWNAEYIAKKGGAVVLNQVQLTPESFHRAIQNLLQDKSKQRTLGSALAAVLPENANTAFITTIESFI